MFSIEGYSLKFKSFEDALEFASSQLLFDFTVLYKICGRIRRVITYKYGEYYSSVEL